MADRPVLNKTTPVMYGRTQARSIRFVNNYEDLENKPQIESVELLGNMSLEDIGIDAEFIAEMGADVFVAKEAGKGLSTNDYTTAEKTKLAGIEAGAEANVNADWDAASGDAQILHKPTIPSKTSELTNDAGFIITETDPTVPSWAKTPSKPTYTASEVGALPDTTVIPTKTSDLTNDSGFVADSSYVHTDNNFTSTEKTKLAGIASGAEVNVNADWNATTGDAAILNKPANIVQDASYVHTDNNYTTTEKNKLAGIEAGAEVNVQSDWNASSGDAQILNKPTNLQTTANLVTSVSSASTDAQYPSAKLLYDTVGNIESLLAAI